MVSAEDNIYSSTAVALAVWQEWRLNTVPKLLTAFGRKATVHLGGSLRSGTFRGPKLSDHPDMVGHRVIELDGRLYLPNSLDPATITEYLQELTGLKEGVKYLENPLWTLEPVKRVLLYSWFERDGYTIELELACIQRKYLFGADPADFWNHVFSKAEAIWTAETRQLMRKMGVAHDAAGGVYDLKKSQVALAKWRIIAGYATGQFREPIPAPIRALIDTWWFHSEPSVPQFCMPLPAKPSPPTWVSNCHALANNWRIVKPPADVEN